MTLDLGEQSQMNGSAVGQQPRANPLRKYSFNLYQSDIDLLRELVARRKASNVTQALRAAIATDAFLLKARDDGEHIFLEGPSGKREIVFM